MSEQCIFCKIVEGKIPSFKIYEDSDAIVFLDINPMHKGHVLIVPKTHHEYIFEVSEPLYSKLFLLAKKLSSKLRLYTKSKKIGLAIEGLSVNHVHIHLVPINSVNDLDPCLSKQADFKELELISSDLRKLLEVEK